MAKVTFEVGDFFEYSFQRGPRTIKMFGRLLSEGRAFAIGKLPLRGEGYHQVLDREVHVGARPITAAEVKHLDYTIQVALDTAWIVGGPVTAITME